jgi:UDP-N-acetylglucosamine 2-epimerase (non-hydrolysing)/GDP/UDP-N,N'-diacetylbacillosamine 2-epimerase (hydrolysing)
MSREEIARYFHFDPKKRIILAGQHPVTTEFDMAARNIRVVIEALNALDEQTVFIYSNSDAGYTKMMWELRLCIRTSGKEDKIKVYRSLPHELYVSLLKNADVMVGNSSSGIVEAPSCNIPYVLVGTRQDGREKARSIIEVHYNKKEILRAVEKALYDRRFKKIVKTCAKPYDPFGDDNAGKRAAEVLATFKITQRLLQKRITY